MTLIGFKVANERIDWPLLRDIWTLADSIDAYDVGWNFDHLYPIYGQPSEPCLEGWTMLAALAEATERIRLGCLVGAVPYRAPAVLAKMAATIDIVSDGRLELGLGAGWHTAEAEAYDLCLPGKLSDRFDLFDEACEIIISLLSNDETNLEGKHFTIRKAHFSPRGPQVPPPVTIGGTGPTRTLRAVARFADWWNTPFWDPADYAQKSEVLESHCVDRGRDPDSIRHSTHVMVMPDHSIDQIAESVGGVLAAGIDQPILYFQPPYGTTIVETAATAVAQLDIDHV